MGRRRRQINRPVEFANPIAGGSTITESVVPQHPPTNFTSNACNLGAAAPTADSLCFDGFSAGLTFDSSDDLFLADSANNRVPGALQASPGRILFLASPDRRTTLPLTRYSARTDLSPLPISRRPTTRATQRSCRRAESCSTLRAISLSPTRATSAFSNTLFQRPLNPPGAASLVLGQCDSFSATGCAAPPNIQAGLEESLKFTFFPAGGSILAGASPSTPPPISTSPTPRTTACSH